MDNEYITSRGIRVRFLGIATLINARQVASATEEPKPPTYTLKNMMGGEEIHYHDETTLQTDEDKAAYADYKKKQTEWGTKQQREFMRLAMLRGIEFEYPKTDDWKKQQKFLGIKVPENTEDNPFAEKLHYIETEVLGGFQDYAALVTGVIRASGVPEELLVQYEESFRGFMAKSAAGTIESAEKRMELQREVRTGADSV